MRKVIATIELDNDLGRGKIYVDQEATDYYSGIDQAYKIKVELPNGDIEEPEIPPQRNMDDVLEAIELSWGSGHVWDLQWNEND